VVGDRPRGWERAKREKKEERKFDGRGNKTIKYIPDQIQSNEAHEPNGRM
jgi:hypothetical protein